MELRQLKYFLAVADARSIVGAANSLFISRQGVSKAIAQLEEDLGVELFMRSAGNVYLTPAGVMFYDRVRSSVLELEQVYEDMQRYGSRYQQRIRLAFSIGTMQLFEAALLQFRAQQENIEIEYREYPEEQCASLLLSHEADIALCMSAACESPVVSMPVLRSPYGVLLRRGEQTVDAITADELKWLPLAGMRDAQTAELAKRLGLGLSYSGYDLYRLFSLTADGACAMLLPEALAPKNWDSLVWLPLEDGGDWQVYRQLFQSQESNILYQTLLDRLQMQVFQQERGGGAHG